MICLFSSPVLTPKVSVRLTVNNLSWSSKVKIGIVFLRVRTRHLRYCFLLTKDCMHNEVWGCAETLPNQHLFHKDSNLGLASFNAFVYLCIKRIYPLQIMQCVRCGSVLFRLEFILRAFFSAFAH